MIVGLTGTLVGIAEDSVIVERQGVAREILVPRYAIGELAAHRGQQVTLHTMEFYEGNQASGHLVPRMLGFLHEEDRLFFTRFVNVKGIGPRKALKALSEPVRRVATWIESGDTKALARLAGIGNRAAEMIVATLKGKMNDLALPDSADTPTEAVRLSQAQQDALEVLVAWGDSRSDVQRWLQRAAQLHPDIETPDQWVRAVYRVKSGAES
ncbi:MAG: Holliday junction branch migration protein RuvA [Planctomycetota bacterium]